MNISNFKSVRDDYCSVTCYNCKSNLNINKYDVIHRKDTQLYRDKLNSSSFFYITCPNCNTDIMVVPTMAEYLLQEKFKYFNQ